MAGSIIDRQRCDACGDCAEACPANALEMLGKRIDAGELLTELLKDRAFYDQSGGGVTLSGGEPTLQASFAEALLDGLQAAGVHTALDTCGLCSRATLERLCPLVDLFLYDLKLIDPAWHQRHTGAGQRAHPGESALAVRTGWVRSRPARSCGSARR